MQAYADGSNEVRDEKGSIAVSKAIAGEVANGYTMNVHNGDLAYADGFLSDWDNYYGKFLSHFSCVCPLIMKDIVLSSCAASWNEAHACILVIVLIGD